MIDCAYLLSGRSSAAPSDRTNVAYQNNLCTTKVFTDLCFIFDVSGTCHFHPHSVLDGLESEQCKRSHFDERKVRVLFANKRERSVLVFLGRIQVRAVRKTGFLGLDGGEKATTKPKGLTGGYCQPT